MYLGKKKKSKYNCVVLRIVYIYLLEMPVF